MSDNKYNTSLIHLLNILFEAMLELQKEFQFYELNLQSFVVYFRRWYGYSTKTVY